MGVGVEPESPLMPMMPTTDLNSCRRNCNVYSVSGWMSQMAETASVAAPWADVEKLFSSVIYEYS
jgi:hypothetical protein